jgi:hypothetical protein
MKKLSILVTALLFNTLHAADWKFSVTVGTGSIDFEEDAYYTTAEGAPNTVNGVQLQSNRSDTYTPSIYGIGFGNGTHTFGYKSTSASSSEYDYVSNIDSNGYVISQQDRDYEESTISYQYRLNSAWTVGVAYNDKEHVRESSDFKNYPLTVFGNASEYTWTGTERTNSTQDGFAVYTTWQTLFANHWVLAVKAGISQTDLDQKFMNVDTLTGVDSALNDIYIEVGLGALNGSTFTTEGIDKGDSTTGYGGISLVRIFPSAPNHQVIFSIDARTDDLAGESIITVDNVGSGYFGNPDRSPETEEPEQVGSANIEEYNIKYTLEYKYTF